NHHTPSRRTYYLPSITYPSSKVITTRISLGNKIFFPNGISSSSPIIVSPQKQFMNTRSKEYKTTKLEAKLSPSKTYDSVEIAAWPKSTFPKNPLRGGIPAKESMLMKNIHPSDG